MTETNRDFTYAEFYMRENELSHRSVEKEMNFYDCVKRGDTENVKKLLTPMGGEGFGILSDDKLRNLKYHFVIMVALITRFCVEGGMEREAAYTLSDTYIRKADKSNSVEEISELHKAAAMDFTERMGTIHRANSYSKPVTDCFEYIYRHLNEKILVKNIADFLNLSVPYLSALFHKETGITINRYINKKRVETACRMLVYSDYEAADIANFLAFSSHSHFIENFKKETGLTPKEYRSRFLHASEGIKAGVDIPLSDMNYT